MLTCNFIGQVLSSTLRQFDADYGLDWLSLSFACPGTNSNSNANTTNLSARQHSQHPAPSQSSSSSSSPSSGTVKDVCCSSVLFSLFNACWSCQWDQDVTGRVATTWPIYASQSHCPFTNDDVVINGTRQRGLIGALPTGVSSQIINSGIHIPPWAFIPPKGNSTW